MSKKKNQIHVQETSPFLQAMVEATRQKFGDEGGVTYMGSEINELVVGIPLPALSLMYLFDSDVFPLGKTVGFAGAPQSQKSALLFELIRWFQGLSGYGKVVECEGNKVSPTLLSSIIGAEGFKQVMIDPCRTIDEARKRIVHTLDFLKKNDPEKKIPFILGLDSATGSTDDETVDKMLGDDDYGGRSYPITALYYTNLLKVLSAEMAGWPFSFVFTNHLKEKPSDMPGLPAKKHMPGGAALMFHSSYVFWLTRIGKEQRMTRMVNGEAVSCPVETRKLLLECFKTSLGTDGRQITVDFSWWYEGENQVSMFDWSAATARMLYGMQDKESAELKQFRGIKMIRGGLEDMLDISVNNQLFTSKKLGLTKLTDHDFGEAVHADAKLMEQLISFMHIKRHPILASIADKAKALTEKVEKAALPAGPDPVSATSDEPMEV